MVEKIYIHLGISSVKLIAFGRPTQQIGNFETVDVRADRYPGGDMKLDH